VINSLSTSELVNLAAQSDETRLRAGLGDVAERFGLADVYAFGSRAKELLGRLAGQATSELREGSDVDIGVRPLAQRRLSARDKAKLAIALSDLFDVARVDLLVLPETGPFVALEVIRGELLYTHDLDEQAEYELYVLRRAGDLAPFERERRRLVLEAGAR
jgi:predicted nucleotidyltransferase